MHWRSKFEQKIHRMGRIGGNTPRMHNQDWPSPLHQEFFFFFSSFYSRILGSDSSGGVFGMGSFIWVDFYF